MAKRSISLFLVITLFVSTIGLVFPSMVSAATTYISASFDNYPNTPSTSGPVAEIGGNWSLFGANTANGDYAIGEAMSGRTDRSVKLVSTTNGNQIYTARFLGSPGIPGKVMFQSSVLFTDTVHDRSINMRNSGTTYATVITFDKTGIVKVNNTNVGAYSANTLYTIRAIVDSPNKKMDVYLNNQLKQSGISLPSNWDSLYVPRFNQTGVTGSVGGMYIDDVKIADYVPVSGVTLPSTLTLAEGGSSTLSASVLPADASMKDLNWTTSNPSVASVDATGVVTAITAGQATITAAALNGGLSASTTVTVNPFVHVQSISLPDSVSVMQSTYSTLNVVFNPSNASDQRVNWSSSDPSVATVSAAGVVSGVALGQAVITATAVDGGATASTNVTVIPYNAPVQGVSLPASVRMQDQDTIKLVPVFNPSDATNKNVTWSTDHPEIATVDANGTVTSYQTGTVHITVTTQDGNKSASTAVTVYHVDPTAFDNFDKMRINYVNLLLGGTGLDTSNSEVASRLATMNDTAVSYWNTMDKDPGRTYLWSDAQPTTPDNSGFSNVSFTRLLTMAMAYSTKQSDLYHNIALRDDIIEGANWIYTHWFNESVVPFGNEWNFSIGAPLRISKLLTLMYEDMPGQTIQNLTRAIDHYDPLPIVSSGANLSDLIIVEVGLGIANKDGNRLSIVRDQMSELFPYVSSDSGMYMDGSFVFHGSVPYTGHYGEVMLAGVANLLYLFNSSAWPVTDPAAQNVFSWIKESFIPVVYQGLTLDLVKGRFIANENSSFDSTAAMINGMARLAPVASAGDASLFKSTIKQWIASNPSVNFYKYLSDLDIIQTVSNWMGISSITAAVDQPAHFEMNGMASSLHRTDAFMFGVSKSSNRISNYEQTNGQNLKGWYTGSGMTYIYNSDKNQYSGTIWPTINWYRLPGTTVDSRPRTNVDNDDAGQGEGPNKNAWAGGTELGTNGISGMMLRPTFTNLQANKSWFMFGNEIIALGSGITDPDDYNVESIVEQRLLNASGDNTLTVDGTVKPTTLGWAETAPSVHWAHLAGNAPGSDIGYYFPDAPQLNFLREQRTGAWYDINASSTSTTPITNNFMTMWFNHGQHPQGASYSYVLLPGKSPAETQEFAANPDFTILENSANAHAVRNNALNMTGINFWNDTTTTVDEVTSNRASSVMLKKDTTQHTLQVAVSDPTLQNTGSIELEINESAASVITNDPEVFVTQLYPTIKMIVNVKGSVGRSFHVSFDTDPAKPRPAAAQPWPVPTNMKEAMPDLPPVTNGYDVFDSEISGNQPTAGWTIQTPSNTTASVEPLAADKSLRLIDSNENQSVTADRKFLQQTGMFEIEWKFAVGYAGDNPAFQMLNGTKPVLQLTAGDSLSWKDSNGESHAIMPLQQNNWYKVKLQVDLNHQSYNVYINNQLVKTSAPFVNASSAADTLRVMTGTGHSVMYVDDVVEYVFGATPVLNETFNSYAAGGLPGDWVISTGGTTSIKVVDDPSTANKSVLISDTDSKASASMSKTFASQNGHFGVTWTYRQGASGPGQYPSFELLSGSTSVIKFTNNNTNGSSGSLKLTLPGGASLDLMPLPTTLWHTISLDVNVPLNQFDIYVDGKLVKTAASFWNVASSVDKIKFSTSSSANVTALNFDRVQVYTVNQDVTAPVTSAAYSPSAPEGQNVWYIHTPVTVSLNVYDDLSGVADSEYSLDGGATWQIYTSPLTFDQDGSYTLSYRSVDKAGNVEAVKNFNFHIIMSGPSIQSVIDGASAGDTIVLSSEVFTEQLNMNKSLTIIGNGATIQAPDTAICDFTGFVNHNNAPVRPVVYIAPGVNAKLQDLIIDGRDKGSVNYPSGISGIGIDSASATIDHVTVTGVNDNMNPGMQYGYGIFAKNTGTTTQTVVVTNSTITDYQKNGIFIMGNIAGTVTGNTVTGHGPTSDIAQNGIVFLNVSGTGTISNNTVSQNYYIGANEACGILVISSPAVTLTADNVVNDNQVPTSVQ